MYKGLGFVKSTRTASSHIYTQPMVFFRTPNARTYATNWFKETESLTTNKPLPTNTPPSCKIVYDGSCPVCSTTVKNLKIENAELINARENSETVKQLEAQGFDLDKGMAVVESDGRVHFGSEAVKEMGRRKGGVFSTLFDSSLTDKLYPFFKKIRNSLIDESIAEQRTRETTEATHDPKTKKM